MAFLFGAANLAALRRTMFSPTSSDEAPLSIPKSVNGTSLDLKDNVVGGVRHVLIPTSGDTTRAADDTQDTPSSPHPPSPNVSIPHAIASVPKKGADIEQGINRSTSESMDWSGTCRALKAHQDGHWQHTSNLTTDVEFAHNLFRYYPKEVSWLMREGVQPDFGFCMPPRQYLSYITMVGHQCGCKHSDFTPTHSKWIHSGMSVAANPILLEGRPDYADASPTVRLARSLAKAQGTICLAGDSIDYQIYMALGNNLKREAQLFKQYVKTDEVLLSVLQREIKVSYSTKPGDWDSFWKNGQRPPDGDGSFLNARRPPPNGFGSMYSILETKAFFKDAGRARFRYYMSYGEEFERATISHL